MASCQRQPNAHKCQVNVTAAAGWAVGIPGATRGAPFGTMAVARALGIVRHPGNVLHGASLRPFPALAGRARHPRARVEGSLPVIAARPASAASRGGPG